MVKRLLSFVLIAFLLSFFVPISISSSALSFGDFRYSVNSDGTATITGRNGLSSNVVIPSSIDGHVVTQIGYDAFKNSDIVTVSIPDTVVTINSNAFLWCSSLKDVSLGNGVKTLGEYAFYHCKSIENIFIPESVTYLGKFAFSECDPSTITIDEKNTVYDSRNNCNAIIETKSNNILIGSRNTVIPEDVESIGSWSFSECYRLKSIIIPNNITSINSTTFLRCNNLSYVEMDSVRTIGDKAFNGTGLSSVSLPKVSSIGVNSFYGCSRLTTVFLGKGLKEIKSAAFDESSITDVYYEGSEEEWNKIYFSSNNKELMNATIHFNSNGLPGFTLLDEYFTHDLQFFASHWDSTQYNPELAHLMMTFANAAYTQSNVQEGYKQLGLTRYNPKFYNETYADYGTEKAPFSMGYVQDDDGTICVLVTIRGSGNPFDFSHGSMDWLGNLSLKTIDEYGLAVNENFYNTMQNVYNALNEYMQFCFNTQWKQMNKLKFFVTGHSRGGAVGNLLEIKLGSIVGKQNVYGYNFAVPDYVKAKRTHNLSNGYENIFNLSHIQDEVSYLPGLVVESMASTQQWFDGGTVDKYSKLGVTVWFDDGQLDEIGLEAHVDGQKYYINYLRNHYSISNYTNNPTIHTEADEVGWGPFVVSRYKHYATYCPVDMELVDENGNIIASVINGVADYHGSHFGDVIIVTEGDHKMIAVPANSKCTLRMTGSDTGTMDYYLAETDIFGEETTAIKNFEGVSLTTGKEMIGKTVNVLDEETKQITTDEKLIVVGDEQREILQNGEEAACNFLYYLGDADNNGIIESTDVTLVQRRLADIETPYSDEILSQGDADGNGELDLIDATVIQYYLAQMKVPYLLGVDVYNSSQSMQCGEKELHYTASGGTSYGYDWTYTGGAGIVNVNCSYDFNAGQYDFVITGVSAGTADIVLFYNSDDDEQIRVPMRVKVDSDLNVSTVDLE